MATIITIMGTPWYLIIFGITYTYELKVDDEPKQTAVGWEYDVRVKAKHIRWFGFKLKTIKYESLGNGL